MFQRKSADIFFFQECKNIKHCYKICSILLNFNKIVPPGKDKSECPLKYLK